ncbi:MAG: T9SS type A sorting domain-containing protein [Microscillaceae bacterium]|nr:T9SS type A sorting domain-containing protein [Microscillaceae bacterium]
MAVSYTSSNTAVATVSGNTVTIVGAGTTIITASQAGNANYNAAPNVTQNLVVNKANQTITFAALAPKTFGDAPFDLTATASSGLPVSYTSSNTAVATVSGNTVTIVGAGTTTITASQAGNANYNAAPNVTQDLVVNKADQTITFAALPAKTVGDAPFDLTATASSGLAVSYTSSNTAVATVSGNTVTIVGAGTTIITASQVGNANYNAAPNVTQNLVVNAAAPQNQTITFECPPTVFAFNSNNNQLVLGAATSSSGLPVTFSITTVPASGVATLSGNVISVQAAGTITLKANVAGNATFNPAEITCDVIEVGLATALLEVEIAEGTQVYPNPVQGYFTVRVETALPEGLHYQVYDALGHLVESGGLEKRNGHQEKLIDLRGKSAGLYFLQISTETGFSLVRRLIKQ